MASRTLASMKSTLPKRVLRFGPSLGNLFSPLQYAVRRFSGIVEDKEKADERIYIKAHEGQALQELRKQFEKEVKAIYKESGEKLDQATLEKLVAWKLHDKIVHM